MRDDTIDDGPLTDINEFDFDAYFEKSSHEMTKEESAEFTMRVIGLFCRDFFQSGGDPAALKPWVVNYIAKQFYFVLAGDEWERAFPLPWTKPTELTTRRGSRAMQIYCHVENTRKDNPKRKVTTLLHEMAEDFCVSYETARGDYYAIKKAVDEKTSMPEWFMKSDD